MTLRVSRSQSLRVVSSDADRTVRLAMSRRVQLTQSVWPLRQKVSLELKLKTLMLLSMEPLTSNCASKCRLTTPSVWPWRVEIHSPVCQFQILMVSVEVRLEYDFAVNATD
jgi:hypothetical protein